MNCRKCGEFLPDAAKFCMRCGEAVVRQPEPETANAFRNTSRPVQLKLCPQCNIQAEGAVVYCRKCGSLLQERWLTGRELFRAEGVNFYEKYWPLAQTQATGKLIILEDKIRFEKTLGGSLGRAFGLVGYAISQKKMKEDPVDEYPMRDIASAVQGDAIIKGSLLTLGLKNRSSVSFVFPKDKVSQAVALIEEYRKYY